MHSDTTLLCSVQPHYLNLTVKIPRLSMCFLGKFSDGIKFRAKLPPCPPASSRGHCLEDATPHDHVTTSRITFQQHRQILVNGFGEAQGARAESGGRVQGVCGAL